MLGLKAEYAYLFTFSEMLAIVQLQVCMYVRVYMCKFMYVRVCACACVCVRVHVCVRACVRACVCVDMHVCMYVCLCSCIHATGVPVFACILTCVCVVCTCMHVQGFSYQLRHYQLNINVTLDPRLQHNTTVFISKKFPGVCQRRRRRTMCCDNCSHLAA